MKLGAFSISLAVQDLEVSRVFYSKLGFEAVGGDGKNYQIMRNGTTVIGLFRGMLQENVLTFNPGWDASGRDLEDFTDVRELFGDLVTREVQFAHSNVGETKSGPASFVLQDPDGNAILFDQHR